MTRPKISEKTYARRRMFPLCAPGIGPNRAEYTQIKRLLEAGDTAGAQRIMLEACKREHHLIFYGPPFRRARGPGRRMRLVMK